MYRLFMNFPRSHIHTFPFSKFFTFTITLRLKKSWLFIQEKESFKKCNLAGGSDVTVEFVQPSSRAKSSALFTPIHAEH